MLKKFLKYAGMTLGALAVIFVLLLMYSYFVEPNLLLINKYTLKIPHWSKELDGFKVVAISDLHAGSNSMTREKLRYVVELANAQEPDAILLLGDYVAQSHGRNGKDLKMAPNVIADDLQGLKAKYGVYAVIGNHDWWFDETAVRTELERVGIKVLENETASFEANGKKVWILGIEDYWKHYKVDIAKPLSEIEPKENIIGITHNPDSFDKTPDSLSILLAGHTHGGQVYLPFIGPPIPVAKKEYTWGHIVHDDRHLFVTKGVGTSGPGIRFCAVPEILVLTFESE
jgi:predicted MPP superfamily phosphohydrolase